MRLRAEQSLDPRKRAELLADALELGGARLALFTQLLELRAARVVVGEELLRERAAPDLLEDRAHPLARAVVDDPRSAREVAVLGDVGDRVAHVLEPALVEKVDDQLQLVQALVVRDLGLVAGGNE